MQTASTYAAVLEAPLEMFIEEYRHYVDLFRGRYDGDKGR
jgi:hypothetical protein